MFGSGLTLAEVEQVEVEREHDDGQRTVYEVSGMDLRGTRLVLSACETGMGAEVVAEGKVLMSEGVSGLRRAFAMAGARTTGMSLGGVGRDGAEHAHPKDWAVFLVSGDDERLDFPAGQEPRVAEDEPPETEGRADCATRRSGRGAPKGSMLIGLLGLTALRRRSR